MAEAVELAHVVRELDKPLDAVWARLADFANVDRIYPKDGIGPFAAIDRVEAQGEGVGTVRTVNPANGVRGIERLEAIDPEQHSFSYSMLPPPVVPVDDYYATVSLSAIGPGRTMVSYKSTGRLKDMPSGDLRAALSILYGALIDDAGGKYDPD